MDEDHLYVWAPSELRAGLAQAIKMWNAAMGQDWLAMTNNRADARVLVQHKGAPAYASSANRTVGRAEVGGARNSDAPSTLHVWIDPLAKGKYAMWVLTHELGHSLGLLDAYGTAPAAHTPSAGGIMNHSTAPGAPEGEQANYERGATNKPFYWPPDAVADVERQQKVPDTAAWMKEFTNMSGHWKTAAELVAVGLRARTAGGADLTGYDENRFWADTATMAHTMSPTNHESENEAKTSQRVVRKSEPAGSSAGSNKRPE